MSKWVEGPGDADMAMALGRPDALAAPVAAERSLLEGCRQGDPQAFAGLVALHERLVFNLAVRMLGDPEEARDVAQEVFLQVFRTLHRFEGRSTVKTWIYRIVVNQCRNRLRWWRRRRRERWVSLESLAAGERVQALPEGGPQHEVERRELGRAVQRALLSLPFSQRSVLLLREVEGLTCDETAELLQIRPGTVKSRLARAREALRHALEQAS